MLIRILGLLLAGYAFYDAFMTYEDGVSPSWEGEGTPAVVVDVIIGIVLVYVAFKGKNRGAYTKIAALKDKKAKDNSNPVKIWTGTYHGHDYRAPKIISVPSSRALGRPTYNEIVDALIDMGYDRDTARVISGASIHDWDFK